MQPSKPSPDSRSPVGASGAAIRLAREGVQPDTPLSRASLAPTIVQAIKSPTFNIGLELARQAGNSLCADLTPGIRRRVHIFSSTSRPA
ncbi:hypothetical protein EMIT0P44_300024 [Pseudomonas sp. IT-P44]